MSWMRFWVCAGNNHHEELHIDLKYQMSGELLGPLTTELTFHDGPYGRPISNVNWGALLRQMNYDAETFEGKGSLGWYGLGPYSEDVPVQFQMWLSEGTSISPGMDGDFLKAFRIVFATLLKRQKEGVIQRRFLGEVLVGGTIPFVDLRLIDTPRSCWESLKSRELDDGDLEIISAGRKKVLDQTDHLDLLVFLGNGPAAFYYGIDTRRHRRRTVLIPYTGPLDRPSQMATVLLADAGSSTFLRAFLERYGPIFRSAAQHSRRIVLIHETGEEGKELSFLLELLDQTGTYQGPISLINLQSGRRVRAGPGLQSVRPQLRARLKLLEPVFLGGSYRGFVGGQIGLIVPPYIWEYWKLDPDRVWYPDKPGASRTIEKIRQNDVNAVDPNPPATQNRIEAPPGAPWFFGQTIR
ncbi:MAG: hypothetical protein M1833_001110 [Piccolia ochrophora]|nr:MAG: hypothetical protein M1833_001110 [Piccolia ochrophora]